MDRLEAHVPPPLTRGITEFQEREGYENRSQAIRELLRRGLDRGERPNLDDLEAVLGPATDTDDDEEGAGT